LRLRCFIAFEIQHLIGDQREHQPVGVNSMAAEHAPRCHGTQRRQQFHDIVGKFVFA